MEIVSTYQPKRKKDELYNLLERKVELKMEIEEQRRLISVSTRQLFIPVSLVSNILNMLTSKMNVSDGINYGFKVAKWVKKWLVSRR